MNEPRDQINMELVLNLEYKLLSGTEIERFIPEIANLRITIFKEFPYLYDGDLDYEKKYLSVYTKSSRSLIAIAINPAQEVVGATTCLPMEDESTEFQKAFIENKYDLSRIFYFGESILLPEYRGQGAGKKFFEFRESHAKNTMADLELTTFCAVNRRIDHPLRPPHYQPLDPFWIRQGYEKQAHLKVHFPWKDIDEAEETEKSMTFWLKKFEAASLR